jgi:translation initiation factor IF-2
MSEMDEGGSRRSSGTGGSKTLSLKRTETSTVRQSFSHGRTKAVVVEKKRARVAPGLPGKAPEGEKPGRHAPEDTSGAREAKEAPVSARAATRGGVVLRELTDDEKEARARALTDAKFAEEEARKHAEVEAARRAVEEERMKRERDAAEKRKVEEEARKHAEEEARRHAEQEAARRLEKKEAAEAATATAPTAVPGKCRRRRGRRRSGGQEGQAFRQGAGAAPQSHPGWPSRRQADHHAGARRSGRAHALRRGLSPAHQSRPSPA